jgi:predicted dehydrogenase
MAKTVRAGVIGAGVFGGYHAQKWAAMEGARLTAVFDTHSERAAALAARVGGEAFDDIAAFLEAVDAVSIASPAVSHGARALQALEAGKPVYVEKPLAVTLDEADAIEAEAARRGLIVACGFAERVAIEATGLYRCRETPRMIEATRFGVASPRNQDVSVVLDLMIHDIDLALSLDAAAPLTVEAEGAAGAGGLLDAARAEVTFVSGTVAILEASRVAESPRRTLRLTYDSGVVEIDFLAGTLNNAAGLNLDPRFASAPGVADRLGASLARFLMAVRGEGRLVADARDGVRALDLALAVERAAGG